MTKSKKQRKNHNHSKNITLTFLVWLILIPLNSFPKMRGERGRKDKSEKKRAKEKKEELLGFLCSNSNPFFLSNIEREEERMIRMKISNMRESSGF